MEQNLSVSIENSVQVTRAIRPNPDEQEFINHLTLGIENTLQAHPMIREIKMIVRPPVSDSCIATWERKHGVKLPIDLKNYYYSTNGFKLTWSLDYADEILPIGDICINSFQLFTPLDIASDESNQESQLDSFSNLTYADMTKMKFGGKSTPKRFPGNLLKAFKLTSNNNIGTTFLVYTNPLNARGGSFEDKPNSSKISYSHSENGRVAESQQCQVYFFDTCLQWHFLAPSFTHYYRMLIYHLGLPEWELRFTPCGLSSFAEQIFWLVAPNLLQPVKKTSYSLVDGKTETWSTEIPSPAFQPNTVLNVLNINMFKRKRKDASNK